jgi:hypothetical protein
MLPGRYNIPYYGPPRFILLLAQPEHLRPEQVPQRPPRMQVVLAQEMPMQMWQEIALPPQFAPATAVAPIPPTAVPVAPPFITQAYQQQWW